MDTDALLGALRPLIVRYRGDSRGLANAFINVLQRAIISTHPERNPGEVFHAINTQLKELFGPVEERTDDQHVKVAGRVLYGIEKLFPELPFENLWAIIDRVLGTPLSPHETALLEELRS
jgi:hypothetical protein